MLDAVAVLIVCIIGMGLMVKPDYKFVRGAIDGRQRLLGMGSVTCAVALVAWVVVDYFLSLGLILWVAVAWAMVLVRGFIHFAYDKRSVARADKKAGTEETGKEHESNV